MKENRELKENELLKQVSTEYSIKLYRLLPSFTELKKYYLQQKERLGVEKAATLENLSTYVFHGELINEIDDKIVVLDGMLNAYLRKGENLRNAKLKNYTLKDITPSMDEYNLKLDINLIKDYKRKILIDYIEQYKQDYLSGKITQKELSHLLDIHDKTISNLCIKNGFKTKALLTPEEISEIYRLYSNKYSISEIANKLGKHNSTVRNYIIKVRDDENFLNSKPYNERLSHDEVIERLGEVNIIPGVEVYSEHISRFNFDLSQTSIQNYMKNIDLVGIYKDQVIFSVEVEISNSIRKSLYNLKNYYKNALIKILYVHPDKLNEAIKERDKISSSTEIRVLKFCNGFESDFFREISKAVRNLNK